ncbi:MAG TPA: VCBS repeat-containing protein [Gemmataceae bacterium]|nr:VCBS repeat-containing protein [Gemmataceae bacterium]
MPRFLRRRPGRRIAIEPLEGRTAPAFVTASSFTVGPNAGYRSNPVAIAVGDFNRDGRPDVATANQDVNGISILLGKGNGTFKAAINYPTGRHPAAIRAVDLNGDGKLDLVTANQDDDTVSVRLGNGDGTFKAAVAFAAGLDPVSIAAGDLNGDGKVDLAVADNGEPTNPDDPGKVTLLFGTGTGKFTPGGTVAVGKHPTSVAIADFNNDDKLDLASVSGGFGHLDVNLNEGGGTFAPKVNYDTGFVANTVVAADLNEDTQPDLVIACKFPSTGGVSVLLGNPDGTFQAFETYVAGGQHPETLAVADFNRDGHLDVVTANGRNDGNTVSVMLGDGMGALGPARLFVGGQGPHGVGVADFNSDGVPDVVTANGGDGLGNDTGLTGHAGTVSLLLGNGDGTLVAAPSLPVAQANHLVAADFNGDNLPDLAVTNGKLLLFQGIGGGAFDPAVPDPIVQGAGALAVGDFNGDQKKDLAVVGKLSTFGATQLLILLGNGDGTFAAPVGFPAGSDLNSIVVADFNGDQKPDLAVANDGTDVIDVLLGNGDGSFGAATTVPCGDGADYLSAGDLNGDGKADLVLASTQANQIRTLLGDGQGGFGPATSYTTEHDPASVGIGRFNGDAKPDLAVPTFFGPGLQVFQAGTNGSYALKGEYDTDSRPIGVTVADFNGDGKLDLAVINNFADTVCVFPGTGLGTFGAPTTYVVGDGPNWAAAADFNGDGRQDLAVANYWGNSITLLETPAPATQFRVRSFPATTTAGVPTKIVVTALDGSGRLVTDYTGTVGFTSADPQAVLPAAYKFTTADHGVHTFSVTLRTVGIQMVTVNDCDPAVFRTGWKV